MAIDASLVLTSLVKRYEDIVRTSQAIGDVNTLPLELQGLPRTETTPAFTPWAR